MYSARINGEDTSFGTSGLLYRSNKVMYDRATRTLWSQLLGEPIIGTLADSGIKLSFFPVSLTNWGEWLAEHPDTTVLSLETGFYTPSLYQPEDDSNSFYFDYRGDAETMFPVWERDERLDAKDEVLGLSVDGVHKAYAIAALRQTRVINDTVGGIDVVLIGSAGSSDARAYMRDGREFAPAEVFLDGRGNEWVVETAPPGLPKTLSDSDGDRWDVTDEALVNADDPSRTLALVPSNVSFWFGWFAFHPDTLVYEDMSP